MDNEPKVLRMVVPDTLNGFAVKAWYTKQEFQGDSYLPHGVALIERGAEVYDPYVVWSVAYNEARVHIRYDGFYTQNFKQAWDEFVRRCNVNG